MLKIKNFFKAVHEFFVELQELRREAHRKYPHLRQD